MRAPSAAGRSDDGCAEHAAQAALDESTVGFLMPMLQLHSLQLDRTNCGDVTLLLSTVFPKLVRLHVGGTPITDNGLRVLSKRASLTELRAPEWCARLSRRRTMRTPRAALWPLGGGCRRCARLLGGGIAAARCLCWVVGLPPRSPLRVRLSRANAAAAAHARAHTCAMRWRAAPAPDLRRLAATPSRTKASRCSRSSSGCGALT
mmetsp:Transcript_57048/g.156652  ORF Transcript_57048/g.156652 Transcript_57048/m.156652 type:complete len:205 (+) Transcript_57048:1163-1777(+)